MGTDKDKRGGAGLSRPSRVVGRRRERRSVTMAADVADRLAAESQRSGVSCSAIVEEALRMRYVMIEEAAPAQRQEGE